MNIRMSHEAVSERLPWFVNGTLPEDEHRQVAAHLDECARCRDSLAVSRQMSDAVRAHRAIPIPPAATADDVLRRTAGSRVPGGPAGWRVAAAVAAMAIAVVLAYSLLAPGTSPNQQFTTATDAPGAATVNYVFELRFARLVGEAARGNVLDSIGGAARAVDASEGVYELTLTLPPQSLAELEARAADMARRDEVASAEVVALQVPVR